MRKSKLIKLLRTFKTEEWKTCRGYLISQTNEDAEVIYVYDYIMHYRKALDHKKLEIDYACTTIFKHKTTKNFQNIMSRLRGMILDYMAVDHMKRDEREMDLHRMMSLNERGLYAEAIQKKDLLVQRIEHVHLDIWNELYVLRAVHSIRFSDNPLKEKESRSSFLSSYDSWSRLKSNLNDYYLLEAENIGKTSRFDMNEAINELRKAVSLDGQDNLTDVNVLLNHLRKVLLEGDKASYQFLYDQLLTHKHLWAPSIGSVILLHLIQSQLRQIKSGTANLNDLYNLYEYGLESGGLLDNGKISDVRFLVMIEVGCLQKSPEYSMNFLKEWAHALDNQTRVEIVLLCEATISFYSGNYTDSLNILSTNAFKLGRPRNTSRELILMNYFGLHRHDKEFMIGQIQNFKDYVRRHKETLSRVQERGLMNFVSLISKLTDGEDISQELEKVDHLVRRTWLRLQSNGRDE